MNTVMTQIVKEKVSKLSAMRARPAHGSRL